MITSGVLAHEGDPLRAVLELIWNSLDADANQVAVTLHRNYFDGVDGVTVTDDGHGMSPEAARAAFRWIGGSWKKTALRSQGRGPTAAWEGRPGAAPRLRSGHPTCGG